MTARCDAPVTVPGVFSSTERDIGRRCLRAEGHDGPHRWQQRWEGLPADVVEAELAAEFEQWDRDEDEPRPDAER